MLVINEFELFEEDGVICAFPFTREGATCGSDFQDAVAMAADWLYENVKYETINGKIPESGVLGNAPQRGGKVVTVAVDFDLSRVDAVDSAQAALMLGVDTATVDQMCKQNLLTFWLDDDQRMILRDSINARLEE